MDALHLADRFYVRFFKSDRRKHTQIHEIVGDKIAIGRLLHVGSRGLDAGKKANSKRNNQNDGNKTRLRPPD